jgi:hypothetical protein
MYFFANREINNKGHYMVKSVQPTTTLTTTGTFGGASVSVVND